MAIREQTNAAPDIDRDSPPYRATLVRRVDLIAADLAAVAESVAECRVPPWGLCDVADRLAKLEREARWLRRDAAKLVPGVEAE